MKNEAKYEMNADGKYDVMYKGFDYNTFHYLSKWKTIYTVDTEDEAKKICADCLDFGD